MSKFLPKSLIVLLLAFVGAVASAQSFDEQIASLIILQDKSVQKDIGITDQERAAMNKFADAHRAKLAAYYKEANGKPDEKKLYEMFSVMKRGVISQMSAAQVKRLREISLQYLDFTALADRTVGAKVGLSDSQHAQIDKFVQSMEQKGKGIEDDAKRIADADPRTKAAKTQQERTAIGMAAFKKVEPRLADLKADTRRKVLATLTPAQRATWQALLGRPFHGS
jgi:hypothetical protein